MINWVHMENKNIGKTLGIAGLVILSKATLSPLFNQPNFVQVTNNEPSISIHAVDVQNPVEKAFDFSGIPLARISNTISSSVAGFYLVPAIVDVDSAIS